MLTYHFKEDYKLHITETKLLPSFLQGYHYIKNKMLQVFCTFERLHLINKSFDIKYMQ